MREEKQGPDIQFGRKVGTKSWESKVGTVSWWYIQDTDLGENHWNEGVVVNVVVNYEDGSDNPPTDVYELALSTEVLLQMLRTVAKNIDKSRSLEAQLAEV